MTTRLNVQKMVTLTHTQHVARIPWAQVIYNHLNTMTRKEQVIPTMSDNI